MHSCFWHWPLGWARRWSRVRASLGSYILTPEVDPVGPNPGGAEFRLLGDLLHHLLSHLEALSSLYLPLVLKNY